jgi:hypothetical protein
MADRRTFWILTASQQSGNYSTQGSTTHTVKQHTTGNKNTHKIVTQYTKDRLLLAAVHTAKAIKFVPAKTKAVDF